MIAKQPIRIDTFPSSILTYPIFSCSSSESVIARRLECSNVRGGVATGIVLSMPVIVEDDVIDDDDDANLACRNRRTMSSS